MSMKSYRNAFRDQECVYSSPDSSIEVVSQPGNPPCLLKRIHCHAPEEAEHAGIQCCPNEGQLFPNVCFGTEHHVQSDREGSIYTYVCMPGGKGCSLKEDVEQHGPVYNHGSQFQWGNSLRSLITSCATLQERRIALPDISPRTLFIDADAAIHLYDFGCQRYPSTDITYMDNEEFFNCISPQIRSAICSRGQSFTEAVYDPIKSVVYSLGATLVFALTGKMPQFANVQCPDRFDAFINDLNATTNWRKVVSFVKKMLTFEEQYRPDFIQLREMLESRLIFTEDEQIQTVPIDDMAPITVEAYCGQAYICTHSADSGSQLQYSEEAPCLVSITALQPLDCVCLIDVSGSMSYDQLAMIQHYFPYFLKRLRSCDRVCLISFSDHAKLKYPFIACTDIGKAVLKQCVSSLRIEDLTNLQEGFTTAMDVIEARRDRNKLVSLILFTDQQFSEETDAIINIKNAISAHLADNFSVNIFKFGDAHGPNLIDILECEGQSFRISDNDSFPELSDLNKRTVARDIRVELRPNNKDWTCARGQQEWFFPGIAANTSQRQLFTLQTSFEPVIRQHRSFLISGTVTYIEDQGRGRTTAVDSKRDIKMSPIDIGEIIKWYRIQGEPCLRTAQQLAVMIESGKMDLLLSRWSGDLGTVAAALELADGKEFRELRERMKRRDWEQSPARPSVGACSQSESTTISPGVSEMSHFSFREEPPALSSFQAPV